MNESKIKIIIMDQRENAINTEKISNDEIENNIEKLKNNNENEQSKIDENKNQSNQNDNQINIQEHENVENSKSDSFLKKLNNSNLPSKANLVINKSNSESPNKDNSNHENLKDIQSRINISCEKKDLITDINNTDENRNDNIDNIEKIDNNNTFERGDETIKKDVQDILQNLDENTKRKDNQEGEFENNYNDNNIVINENRGFVEKERDCQEENLINKSNKSALPDGNLEDVVNSNNNNSQVQNLEKHKIDPENKENEEEKNEKSISGSK